MSYVGFILVDKPQGWTSHDVVAKIRKHTGGKVGHAGTLDPMATGLLVLALGKATRLLRFLQSQPKEYVATAVFGVATDSLDADGAILGREPLSVSEADVRAVMARFEGRILQVPPMISARKIEGKRLYSLAREGKVVEREPRPVEIYHLALIELAPGSYPEVTFEVRCGTGTYVRTLADDIARSLGGRAHLERAAANEERITLRRIGPHRRGGRSLRRGRRSRSVGRAAFGCARRHGRGDHRSRAPAGGAQRRHGAGDHSPRRASR